MWGRVRRRQENPAMTQLAQLRTSNPAVHTPCRLRPALKWVQQRVAVFRIPSPFQLYHKVSELIAFSFNAKDVEHCVDAPGTV